MVTQKPQKVGKKKEDMIMKKTFSNIRTLAALLMAGAAFAACSSNDDNIIENQQPANPGEQVYTLTINASKGDGTTRALSLDGSGKLTASWANGDELTVYNASKGAYLTGTLTASNALGSTATFSGALTGTIEVGNYLELLYRPIDFASFNNQDGTLKGTNGAEKYDKAFADVKVASVDGSGNITIKESSADFNTEVAMLKLTLQDNAATPNKLNATSLTISVDGFGDLYTFSPTAATYTANGNGILYFALPGSWDAADMKGKSEDDIKTATVTFTATVGGKTYTATKPGYKFVNGKYYAATLTMAEVIPALNLTSPAVGQVIGDDGKNYDYASLPGGVTAVAKICYVSGEHGLALALADETGTMNWSTAITTAAAHTPAFTGGTWKLATRDEWDNMITAAGGDENLRTGFSSVGGTNMHAHTYWSSTEHNASNAWFYHFGSNNWNGNSKNLELLVRACLAF